MFAEMISDTELTEINKPIQLRHPALPGIAERCNKLCLEFSCHKLERIGTVSATVLFHCALSIVVVNLVFVRAFEVYLKTHSLSNLLDMFTQPCSLVHHTYENFI